MMETHWHDRGIYPTAAEIASGKAEATLLPRNHFFQIQLGMGDSPQKVGEPSEREEMDMRQNEIESADWLPDSYRAANEELHLIYRGWPGSNLPCIVVFNL